MNWEAVGALGELLGSVAVFVTLGYLAVQLRHARREMHRSISQGRGQAMRDLFTHMGSERNTATVVKVHAMLGAAHSPFVATLVERAGVTPEDALAAQTLQLSWWNYRLGIIPFADDLSPIERHQFDAAIARSYGTPGVSQLFYEHNKALAHPDAVRYIESVLRVPSSPDRQ